MTTFDDIKKILEDAVGSDDIGKHKNFWRTTREKFIALEVYKKPVLIVGNGKESNLIKALKGEPPFDGTFAPRMPVNYDAVPPEKIAIIEEWINDGCH